MTGPEQAEVAVRLAALAQVPVTSVAAVGAQHRWRHYRAGLADGRTVFAKVASEDLGGIFAAEARGLRWLAEAHAVPVPEVVCWDERLLAVSWLAAGAPDAVTAHRFGSDLARMHLAGAPRFGAAWPGFIASLPLPNEGVETHGTPSWAQWYIARRLAPYLRRAADAGLLSAADIAAVEAVMDRIEDLAGPPEPPSRIHGDCWSGNLVWAQDRGWLIDPAAHGGHRESDLAMLTLFGAPFADQILAGYQEMAPLAPGWRERVPLHQLHPLLVHVCLFGGAYRDAVREAARRLLRS